MPDGPAPVLAPEHRDALTRALRQAGRDEVLPRFRMLAAHEVSTKSGPADLVTLADTRAEAHITAAMQAAWPEALVAGEEAVAADPALRDRMGTAEWAVIIDPVDGTWNYAKGLALFGMIAAVLHRGVPVHGLLYDPILDDWVSADTTGPATITMGDGAPAVLSTSAETRVGRMNGYVTLGLFPRPMKERIVQSFPDYARVTSLRCACHEYRMVAQGHAEFALSGPKPHPWDHAAGVLAVERAGGVARMIDGRPYSAGITDGVVLAAASQAVWDEIAGRYDYLADI
ncbi:MAG: inositol monophosphatase [Rubellimicrobium sp.]|nr:inositol monophosphatase [Rubellimicrobium sp.]